MQVSEPNKITTSTTAMLSLSRIIVLCLSVFVLLFVVAHTSDTTANGNDECSLGHC